jgi:hypothetical protein
MLAGIFLPGHAWAGLKTGYGHCRSSAGVAIQAIHFEPFHLLLRIFLSPNARSEENSQGYGRDYPEYLYLRHILILTYQHS